MGAGRIQLLQTIVVDMSALGNADAEAYIIGADTIPHFVRLPGGQSKGRPMSAPSLLSAVFPGCVILCCLSFEDKVSVAM